MITIDNIAIGFIGIITIYILCRLAAYAIFKSWFQAKHHEEERKESSNGKRQKKEAFIERRKT